MENDVQDAMRILFELHNCGTSHWHYNLYTLYVWNITQHYLANCDLQRITLITHDHNNHPYDNQLNYAGGTYNGCIPAKNFG